MDMFMVVSLHFLLFCHSCYNYFSVRVKGGMSLWNGMWHGLRNDIIMPNEKYGKWRKEIN